MLDFQQAGLLKNNEPLDFLDFADMQLQDDRAIELVLPPLPPGFHQLSILLIADPASLSRDKLYRFLQQKSFFEARYDL